MLFLISFFNDYPDVEKHKFHFFKHIIVISNFSEYLVQYSLCDFRRLCTRKLATNYVKIIHEATISSQKLKLSSFM